MDIVERLRQAESVKDYFGDWELYKEAANEIERLRRDVEEANARAYVMAKEVTLWQSRAALKEDE
jgi:hypothetical protein